MGASENAMETRKRIAFKVNGKRIEADVDPWMTLAEFLREELGLTGTKVGCNRGECGSCTVVVEGEAVYSCYHAGGRGRGQGACSPSKGSWRTASSIPCRKRSSSMTPCSAGTAPRECSCPSSALLQRHSRPTEDDIRNAIDGNACRCGCFPNIIRGHAGRLPESGLLSKGSGRWLRANCWSKAPPLLPWTGN